MCMSVIAATGGGGGYVSSDDQQVSLAGGEYVTSDGHQVSLAGAGYVPVMATRGMSRGGWGYIQRGYVWGGYFMGPGITIPHHY